MELTFQHAVWANGLPRAEWDLPTLPYYPAFRHTQGGTVRKSFPCFQYGGAVLLSKTDLDLSVVLRGEPPEGTLLVLTTGIKWVQARDAAKHPLILGQPPLPQQRFIWSKMSVVPR